MKIYTKIGIGLLLGALIGPFLGEYALIIEPIGKAFIKLIVMLVIPLVMASLISGTASLGDIRKLGRIGLKTIIYYIIFTALAVGLGLLLANTIKPGMGLDPKAKAKLLANTGKTGIGLDTQAKQELTADYKEITSSAIIGSDGTIYIGSDNGKLYAIKPDGSKKWAFNIKSAIISSPSIGNDGTIYVGSNNGMLYAIRPDKSEKWAFNTGGSVRSSPAIGSNGIIYVGSLDGILYAINPDGSKQWAFNTSSAVFSSPAIGDDGTIYVGSNNGKLYAINPDGKMKWAFATAGDVRSSPALGDDGTIYVGSNDFKLYAINPDGSKKWVFNNIDAFNSSPNIGSDGTIYIGSDDNKLYAIEPDGSLKWIFATNGDIRSSPVLGDDGTIYIGSWDNKLYALNPDGSKSWAYATGGNVSSTAILGSDSTIYVGVKDGKVYAIKPDGSLKWVFSTTQIGKAVDRLANIFLNLIPSNPFKAMAEGNMLPIIVFSILFGIGMTMIAKERRDGLLSLLDGINDTMIKLVEIVMKLAPYAVFALIAGVAGRFGFRILLNLAKYVLVTIFGLLTYMIIVYSVSVKFLGGISPLRFFKVFLPVQLTAFSTSSSNATLPINMKTTMEELNVPKDITSFVLPLGATVNMNGTAIYHGVSALFIAQVYGWNLSVYDQLLIVLTATLASIGCAGVPGIGMITLTIVLTAINPQLVEGIALVMGVERILDMFRTTLNVTGDSTCAIFVAWSEGVLKTSPAVKPANPK